MSCKEIQPIGGGGDPFPDRYADFSDCLYRTPFLKSPGSGSQQDMGMREFFEHDMAQNLSCLPDCMITGTHPRMLNELPPSEARLYNTMLPDKFEPFCIEKVAPCCIGTPIARFLDAGGGNQTFRGPLLKNPSVADASRLADGGAQNVARGRSQGRFFR